MTTWRSIDASFLPGASGTERAAALLGGIIFSISDIALGESNKTVQLHRNHTNTTPIPRRYHYSVHRYQCICPPNSKFKGCDFEYLLFGSILPLDLGHLRCRTTKAGFQIVDFLAF